MDFVKARKNTEDLFSALHKSANSWRYFCIIEGMAILILIVGIIYVAATSRPIPWVVQVDEHGYEISVGPVGSQKIDARIIISKIGRFISDVRSVVSDHKAQRLFIERAYISIPDGSPAQNTTNIYYREHDPFKLAIQQETVQVDVRSVLPVSENTYRAEWVERHMKNGSQYNEQLWTGLFTIGITPVKDVKSIIDNPLGIYITEYQATRNYN